MILAQLPEAIIIEAGVCKIDQSSGGLLRADKGICNSRDVKVRVWQTGSDFTLNGISSGVVMMNLVGVNKVQGGFSGGIPREDTERELQLIKILLYIFLKSFWRR